MSLFPLGVVSVGPGKIFSVHKCQKAMRCGFLAGGPMWGLCQEELGEEDIHYAVKFLF